MYKVKKITRNDINKNKMVALGYCQIQYTLNLFADEYKVGYNTGIYGWNYALYTIGNYDIVTGYNVPYEKYSNKQTKNKLITFDNKLQNMKAADIYNNYESLKKEFLRIFE